MCTFGKKPIGFRNTTRTFNWSHYTEKYFKYSGG